MTKYLIPAGIALLLLQACTGNGNKPSVSEPQFSVATFRSGNGWAYSVYINNKEYIRQLFVPAIAGKHMFPSEASARRTGMLVIEKMKHTGSPSLSSREVQQLHLTDSDTSGNH